MLDEGKIDRDEYESLKADLLAEGTVERGSMQGKQPGWYKDPSGVAEHEAYWDGQSWTGETRRVFVDGTGVMSEGRRLTEGEIWFKYEGRISTGQYWGRFILYWIATFIVTFVVASGGDPDVVDAFVAILFLFSIWPATALAWKRLHDQDRSGAMFFLVLIPFVGPIVWLVFSLLGGTPGPNQYGPSSGYRWERRSE